MGGTCENRSSMRRNVWIKAKNKSRIKRMSGPELSEPSEGKRTALARWYIMTGCSKVILGQKFTINDKVDIYILKRSLLKVKSDPFQNTDDSKRSSGMIRLNDIKNVLYKKEGPISPRPRVHGSLVLLFLRPLLLGSYNPINSQVKKNETEKKPHLCSHLYNF